MKTPSAACRPALAMMVAGLIATADARDGDAPAPWSETPCNDVCEWWMRLGKPDAPAGAPVPRPSPQAIMPVDLTPVIHPKAHIDILARPEPPRMRGGTPVRVRTVPVADVRPVLAGAEAAPAAAWGRPMRGSAPVLPAAFAPTH